MLELDLLSAEERQSKDNVDLSPQASSKTFWRSISDLENSPQYQSFVSGEFKSGAVSEEAPSDNARRKFVQIMGASAAMAGLAACRKPYQKILPYTRQPEEIIPGKPLYYASAMPFQGVLHPVLIESHEGRPTKIEGNPDHPSSKGATSSGLFEQASILNMFDPDRVQKPMKGGKETTWAAVLAALRGLGGKGVAVIAPSTSSPTLLAQKAAFLAKNQANQWVTFDAVGDSAEAMGNQLAFGSAYRNLYRFSKAKTVVSLEADFLAPTAQNATSNAREFALSRKMASNKDAISRLYVIESGFSMTGGLADNRRALKSSEVSQFAVALAAKLGVAGVGGSAGEFSNDKWVNEIAKDLQANRGAGVVLAGENQPAVVHALCAAINGVLGNIGTTVEVLDAGNGTLTPQFDQLKGLLNAINGGQIGAVVNLGANVVYSAPTDIDVKAALGKVPSFYLAHLNDETAQASQYVLPLTHFIEAWGDGRTFDGVLTPIQPLIAPLNDAKSEIEVLDMLNNGTTTSGFDLIKGTAGAANLTKALHDGYFEGAGYAQVSPSANTGAIAGALGQIKPAGKSDLEVVFRPCTKVYDGAFSNNAWVQELPDALTKVVWENVALMHPKTAEKLGLKVELSDGNYYVDRVDVSVGGKKINLPAWVSYGVAENALILNLGYGRKIKTHRPNAPLGFFDKGFFGTEKSVDIYGYGALANACGSAVEQLRTSNGFYSATGVSISKTDGGYEVVTTQDHGALDWGKGEGIEEQQKRRIVRTTTVEGYKENPEFTKDHFPEFAKEVLEKEGKKEDWAEYPALWEKNGNQAANTPEIKNSIYAKHQWGMTIDLNSCNGCNACVVACNSENNISMIGKEQVGWGREMAWMRIDRYFVGTQENPGMVLQPMLCQHCENAPCEQVCPVAATSHSPDGINEMTYNRCVGTRYCSNNCPYKVRRYNYFNWTKDIPKVTQMVHNPNVTVRFRGVMEKCTFCVQRVREAGIEARKERRMLKDGEVMTACQQACPAQAISFGNVADPNSQVSQLRKLDRGYEVLAELANRPRITYLARISNPNPNLESGIALAKTEAHGHGATHKEGH